MTRRTRRRLYVTALAALVGTSAPAWAPPVLRTFSTFRVEKVEVEGNRYVPAERIVELARLAPDASVWAEEDPWLEGVRSHPMIREADVRRSGLRTLTFRVREAEPIALAATPELVPVDAEGRVLPLDPAEAGLDLPILGGRVTVEKGRLSDARARRLLETLVRLRGEAPDFVRQASEFGIAEGGDVEVIMSEAGPCERVLLPASEPLVGLRRVEMALGAHDGSRDVETADARFAKQVVLRLGGGP